MCDNVRLSARLLVPVTAPALSGGVISFAGGRIIEVQPSGATESAIDLGDVAILPGLVNAHTHLEFSELSQPLGRPGQPFVDWIRDVIVHRAQNVSNTESAIQRGLDECVQTGATTIGEIATAGWQADAQFDTSAHVTVFRELRGMSDERMSNALSDARRHVGAAESPSWLAGLSPHAPYSVGDALFDEAVTLSSTSGAPLAFHLAESPEEIEFLRWRGGPFRQLLEDLGAWSDAALAANCTPMDYLRRLLRGSRSLVIHGNYLDDEALEFMAEHASRLTLVYCPRTHAYFAHPRHPAAELLCRGGAVALGTDSRASNPDLSIWAEMCFAAEHHPDLRPADVLRMGTLAGAEALGRGDDVGSLDVGKRADLAIVAAGDGAAINGEQGLFTAADTRVVATVIDGAVRHVDAAWSQTLGVDARRWLDATD